MLATVILRGKRKKKLCKTVVTSKKRFFYRRGCVVTKPDVFKPFILPATPRNQKYFLVPVSRILMTFSGSDSLFFDRIRVVTVKIHLQVQGRCYVSLCQNHESIVQCLKFQIREIKRMVMDPDPQHQMFV